MLLKLIVLTILTLIVALLSFNFFVLDLKDLFEIGKTDVTQDEGCFVKNGILGAEDQTRWNDQVLLSS